MFFLIPGRRTILRRLALLDARIFKLEQQMASTLDDLKAEVDKQGTVIGSAITLLQGISDRISTTNGDQAKLDALKDEIDAQTAQLAAAVQANTPAAATTAASTDQTQTAGGTDTTTAASGS